ncbi:uncharacterized protein LOC106174290 [Lingula anatina]|uniref:Uncharacterized protein LOC106174290 n=1 Tax=Lingula anatina TaxID=7574 RepID=A0A2R2MRA3_LINAN|nr:uncharacterized protein LOC106174290 [Lingula anatina]|eukprot:XP_023932673.1 uncharacterized protein LOC106174290 [Lingula anatina]
MEYFAKLGCLLIDHGTEGLRKYFQNHILCGQTPQQFFTTNKTDIDDLRHGRHGCKRLINKRQYDLIFPANNQPPNLKVFDITLTFLLIRQFQVGNTRPNDPVWNDPAKAAGAPQDMQDIILLKFERNSLAHRESTDITPSEFEQKWTTISSAVMRLEVLTTEEIQGKFLIKYASYVATWMRWKC